MVIPSPLTLALATLALLTGCAKPPPPAPVPLLPDWIVTMPNHCGREGFGFSNHGNSHHGTAGIGGTDCREFDSIEGEDAK